MIPLQCPNCESEIDLIETKEKSKLVRINELGAEEKLEFETIIKILCGGCDEEFYTTMTTWAEHVETFL